MRQKFITKGIRSLTQNEIVLLQNAINLLQYTTFKFISVPIFRSGSHGFCVFAAHLENIGKPGICVTLISMGVLGRNMYRETLE